MGEIGSSTVKKTGRMAHVLEFLAIVLLAALAAYAAS